MREEPPFNIYQEQLISLYQGLPLWKPNPVRGIYDRVSIGDVGYVSEGGFIRMFNVTLSPGDGQNRRLGSQAGPAPCYEPLTLDDFAIHPDTFGKDECRSRRVSREEDLYPATSHE